MREQHKFDWWTINALNAVSAIAQIGQFGIAYVVLPVWLAERGANAVELGLFAASLWLGQLPGLGGAPWLCRRWGERAVILAGLASTVIGLAMVAWAGWPVFLLGGMCAGLGLGLRWIGLEPWLYRIAPDHARGRLVGFHETLIALAPVVGPVLAGYVGLQGYGVMGVGLVFTVLSLLPLAAAKEPPASLTQDPHVSGRRDRSLPWHERVFVQGMVIALLGGMMEAAVSGLFAVYAQDQSVPAERVPDLLAMFGLGGLLMQYPVGWLADHRSVGTSGAVCALGTVVVAIALYPALGVSWMAMSLFLLGGFITGFLTLALIASAKTRSGDMVRKVSVISMVYTGSAVLGPLLASAAVNASDGRALMGFTALAAATMAGLLIWVAVVKNRLVA